MSESKALAIVPRNMDECVSLADRLSKATTLASELRDKPANVLAAIMAGQELGFSPMAALRSIHIIKGIPKLSADAMVAAVLASGKAQYFEPTDTSATSVTWVTKRVGSTREQSITWTAEDAKRAGLTSDNHRLYPRQMLSSRAKSELARSIYPDVLAGVYSDDEITDDRPLQSVPNANTDAVDAEIVSETKSATLTESDALEMIGATTTVAALDDLKASFAVFRGDARARVKKHFDAKRAALTAIVEVLTPAEGAA